MARTGTVKRDTKETKITAIISPDGGAVQVGTGMPFWDHMLTLLGTHSAFALQVSALGDIEIDDHHTLEDTGIALGQALKQALGDCRGITRFADVTVPMDEALAHCVLDISNRPLLVYTVHSGTPAPDTRLQLAEEFFRAFAQNAGLTLHLSITAGANEHHMLEAAFKALARALRIACAIDPQRPDTVPSSKGVL